MFDPFESSITETRIGPKNDLAHGREQPFAGRHVGAADEDRGVVQVFGSAREDGAVHEIADRVFGDAAVAHDLVGAAVEGDDAIEDAGVGETCRVAGGVCARREGVRADATAPALTET